MGLILGTLRAFAGYLSQAVFFSFVRYCKEFVLMTRDSDACEKGGYNMFSDSYFRPGIYILRVIIIDVSKSRSWQT